jgi:hypothetical protein
MTSGIAAANAVGNAAHEASPWVKVLARVGFASRGVLSCIIGVLAVMAALGIGRGTTTDSKGALRVIYDQPFGQVLLTLVAVGLFGYSVWLFVQAILDPEHTARRPKRGPLMRIGRFFAGVIHVGLGAYAVGLVTGIALGSDEDGAKSWTARLLGWDGVGVVIVAAFGLLVIGIGLFDVYKAFKNKLDERLDLSRLGRASRRVVVDICRFGLGARAVVFVLTGSFLILAAVRTDPADAKGLGETLAHIGRASYGLILLSVVALGFVAYGVYQLVEARYRRIDAG